MNRTKIVFLLLIGFSAITKSWAQFELSSVFQPQGTEYWKQNNFFHPQLRVGLNVKVIPYTELQANILGNNSFTLVTGGIGFRSKKGFGFGFNIGNIRDRKIVYEYNTKDKDLTETMFYGIYIKNSQFRKNHYSLLIGYGEATINKINIFGFYTHSFGKKIGLGINVDYYQTSGLRFEYNIHSEEEEGYLILYSALGYNIQNNTPGLTIGFKFGEINID